MAKETGRLNHENALTFYKTVRLPVPPFFKIASINIPSIIFYPALVIAILFPSFIAFLPPPFINPLTIFLFTNT